MSNYNKSKELDYTNKKEVIMYTGEIYKELFKIIHTLQPNTKLILTNEYYNLLIKSMVDNLDMDDFKIFFEVYEVIRTYIECYNFENLAYELLNWKLIKIEINSEDKFKELLGDYISNFEAVMPEMKPLFKCIDDIFINFESVLNYFVKDRSKIKEFKRDYRSCESENYNEEEIMNYMHDIFNEVFYVSRKLVRTNGEMLNLISEEYQNLVFDFLTEFIPLQYYQIIFELYDSLKIFIRNIDLRKLIDETKKFNMKVFNISTENLLRDLLNAYVSNGRIKNFINSLLNKLSRVFKVLDFVLAHPKNILKNAEVFIEDKNELFEM